MPINVGDLPEYEAGSYGASELRQAKANAEVAKIINPSTGGGGTTTVDFGTKITAATMPAGGTGLLGWVSGIFDKLPSLSGGKIPVEVSSLNVTVDNANLEISNEVGNPIPVRIMGLNYLNFRQVINTSGDNTIISAPGVGFCICLVELVAINKSTTKTVILFKQGSTVWGDIVPVSEGQGLTKDYVGDTIRKLPGNTAFISNLSGNNECVIWGRYYVEAA